MPGSGRFSCIGAAAARLAPLFAACLLLSWPALSVGQACGSLRNDVGPYDYSAPSSLAASSRADSLLAQVEQRYFQPDIENLSRRGRDGQLDLSALVAGLEATLRAFPNHHRALYTAIKLELQVGRLPQASNWRWLRSADCFLERARRFRPDDPIVHLLHGLFLHRQGKRDEALAAYRRAEALKSDLADLQYNMGLLYFELGKYPLAKEYAERAYSLNHRHPGLRRKLTEAGHWP